MPDAAPRLSPGQVEQAILTWSRHNLSGSTGQGIGAVSPGLRADVGWLNALDLDGLRPFDAELCREADGYEGWREMAAVGAFPAGELTVVYRKTASVGLDSTKRNRFLVQLLVGRAGKLDLGSVADDASVWLRPEQCPQDALPKLAALPLAQLEARDAGHDCAALDAKARTLLERLVGHPQGLEPFHPAVPADLARLLLICLPAALWSQARLGWWVGATGPVARVGPIGALPNPEPSRQVGANGLGECRFHAWIEDIWETIPAEARSWAGFAQAFQARTEPRPARTAPADHEPAPSPDGATAAERARAAIAAAIAAASWDPSRRLGNVEAIQALSAIERLALPGEGWLAALSPAELAAIFAGIDTTAGFGRALQFFRATATAPEDLARGWEETGLAALGLGALYLAPAAEAAPSLRLPRRPEAAETRKLVAYLRRNEHGLELLARFAHEAAWSAEGRAALVAALAGAEASPREIFETVLARAELPPHLQVEFMRENIDDTIEWLAVPAPYENALRTLLGERPRFAFHVLRHSVKIFDS